MRQESTTREKEAEGGEGSEVTPRHEREKVLQQGERELTSLPMLRARREEDETAPRPRSDGGPCQRARGERRSTVPQHHRAPAKERREPR
eukprot:1697800-Rhodomonas_salina.1